MGYYYYFFAAKDRNNTISPCGLLILAAIKSKQLCIPTNAYCRSQKREASFAAEPIS